jgi:hypothetical protein
MDFMEKCHTSYTSFTNMQKFVVLELELEMEGFARFGGAPNLAGGPTKRGPI